MSKRLTWRELEARTFDAKTIARLHAEADVLAEELHLPQIRKARGLTQEAMADLLGVQQAEVSKIEHRAELYVGTLRRFVEAMNGELILAARFADGIEVPIRLADGDLRTYATTKDVKASAARMTKKHGKALKRLAK